MRHLCRSWDWNDPRLLRQEPCQRDLSGRCLLSFCPFFQKLNDLQVVGQVLRRETGFDAANVALRKSCILVDRAREETHADWAPRNEADAQLLAQRDDL